MLLGKPTSNPPVMIDTSLESPVSFDNAVDESGETWGRKMSLKKKKEQGEDIKQMKMKFRGRKGKQDGNKVKEKSVVQKTKKRESSKRDKVEKVLDTFCEAIL